MPASDSQLAPAPPPLPLRPGEPRQRWREGPPEDPHTISAAESAAAPALEPAPSPAKPPPLPPPLPATATTAPPAAPKATEPPPDQEEPKQPRRWGDIFLTVPSWAVSMIVHMIVVIILALCTVAPKVASQFIVVEGSQVEPVDEIVEETIQLIEFQALKEHTFASVVADGDFGMADLGNSSEVSSVFTDVDAGDIQIGDAATDFGQLFGSQGNGMASLGNGTGGAEFFGVKATGRKFVFIVDSSNSMRGGKFDDAREELFYAIQRLKSDQYFYVIFFDRDADRMTFAPNTEPEETYAQATAANIKKLDDWMKTVQNEGQTVPYDALVFARTLSPDAIYLLTDGKFTDRGRSVSYLRTTNLFQDPGEGLKPKSIVHTVGFYDPDGEETLKEIAKDHQGTYRFVPRPKQALPKRMQQAQK